ncbi:hypothetical protein [Gracilibacillus alcaliphilus]|uniref:hypothetical protein n=1 Tax=Gracilibacillus alcaliphilus TaxID=1401441 RepID=UPI00195BA9F8|nr:hypothetical protein [Gracilibacillus alcaliphilus]MBM7678658.1 hypothetical protein [Gracilibacillus alcaliphilus]
MIIQLKGKVKYPITLDPSVWIFDDRKIRLEEAFREKPETEEEQETIGRLHKPPVNHSIKKYNKKELLNDSYVMPIKEFIENAEIDKHAQGVTIITEQEEYHISLATLLQSLLLFSLNGKQIKEGGPAHLYFGDGSNQDNPIKAIKIIEIH